MFCTWQNAAPSASLAVAGVLCMLASISQSRFRGTLVPWDVRGQNGKSTVLGEMLGTLCDQVPSSGMVALLSCV